MSSSDLPKLWTTSSNFWFCVKKWSVYFSLKNISLGDKLYFQKMCPIFVGSVCNFGRSDNDIISWKNGYFQNMKWPGFMRNLIKKSWPVSNQECLCTFLELRRFFKNFFDVWKEGWWILEYIVVLKLIYFNGISPVHSFILFFFC